MFPATGWSVEAGCIGVHGVLWGKQNAKALRLSANIENMGCPWVFGAVMVTSNGKRDGVVLRRGL